MKRAQADHVAIFRTVERRDLRGYRTAMRDHLENAQVNLLRHVRSEMGGNGRGHRSSEKRLAGRAFVTDTLHTSGGGDHSHEEP
jgi:hypothetical protein